MLENNALILNAIALLRRNGYTVIAPDEEVENDAEAGDDGGGDDGGVPPAGPKGPHS